MKTDVRFKKLFKKMRKTITFISITEEMNKVVNKCNDDGIIITDKKRNDLEQTRILLTIIREPKIFEEYSQIIKDGIKEEKESANKRLLKSKMYKA